MAGIDIHEIESAPRRASDMALPEWHGGLDQPLVLTPDMSDGYPKPSAAEILPTLGRVGDSKKTGLNLESD